MQCAGLSLSRPLLWSTGSRHAGSVIVAHGPSCSVACGIFPDQGLNPCPLNWQADSQPLCHQGSPPFLFFLKKPLICYETKSFVIFIWLVESSLCRSTCSCVPCISCEPELELKSVCVRDFPGGPVVGSPPSSVGDAGSIPGQGTKIPHAMGQLSPRAATKI